MGKKDLAREPVNVLHCEPTGDEADAHRFAPIDRCISLITIALAFLCVMHQRAAFTFRGFHFEFPLKILDTIDVLRVPSLLNPITAAMIAVIFIIIRVGKMQKPFSGLSREGHKMIRGLKRWPCDPAPPPQTLRVYPCFAARSSRHAPSVVPTLPEASGCLGLHSSQRQRGDSVTGSHYGQHDKAAGIFRGPITNIEGLRIDVWRQLLFPVKMGLTISLRFLDHQ